MNAYPQQSMPLWSPRTLMSIALAVAIISTVHVLFPGRPGVEPPVLQPVANNAAMPRSGTGAATTAVTTAATQNSEASASVSAITRAGAGADAAAAAASQRGSRLVPTHRQQPAPVLSEVPLLYALPASLQTLWQREDYAALSQALLLRASDAVAKADPLGLADNLALLATTALAERNLDAASVYLRESADVLRHADGDTGFNAALAQQAKIKIELLTGQLHLTHRHRARQAARVYDTMQLAGWKIANGQFYDAVPGLQQAIATNIDLDRYGAAAAAHETLRRGYLLNDDRDAALTSGQEAVRLHAASGRDRRARRLLQDLASEGLDRDSIQSLGREISALQREHEKDIRQLNRAADYEQLYGRFVAAGDPVQAWQFRLKANASLTGVDRRAMHRRQVGVIALLYTSNDNLRDADRSLRQVTEQLQTLPQPQPPSSPTAATRQAAADGSDPEPVTPAADAAARFDAELLLSLSRSLQLQLY